SAQHVLVVNQAFARQNWPGQDGVGKIVLPPNMKDNRYRVIGIAGDEHQLGPDAISRPQIYIAARGLQTMILLVRTAADPMALAPAVQRQLWNIDKEQPVRDVRTMQGVLHEWTGERR